MKKKLIFLDTETTGVEDTDRLCQIAYKLAGSKISFCSLFKPPVLISIDAMSITHITNEDVEKATIFKGSLHAQSLQKTLENPDMVFVAHNADFDMKFLTREDIVLPKDHICTMKMAHYHDKEGVLGKHNLQYLRYYYGLKFDQKINPHDALSDITVLEGLFNYYLGHYSIEEMIAVSAKPILFKKWNFGKYKGEWFKDVVVKDRSYLEWAWKNMTLDENMKYTIQFYLKGHHRTNKF